MISTICGKITSGLLRELRYAFYLTVHPFKGFWEIKKEGRGSVRTATVLLVAFILATVLSGMYTGYLFNGSDQLDYSPVKGVIKVLLLFFGFCIANWCFTCLFDGEGSFTDIYKATSYAMLPLLTVQIILIPMSNYFLLTEKPFYSAIYSIALLWTIFLLVIGTLVTHQYSLGKTIVSCVCIIAGMCILAYIALLFFNLMQQVIGFIVTIAQEFSTR